MRSAIAFEGPLRIADAERVWRELHDAGDVTRIDLSRASIVDGAIMSLFVEARAELAARGVHAEIVGGSERVRKLVHLYHGDEPPKPAEPPPRTPNPIERVGALTARAGEGSRHAVEFVGDVTAAVARLGRDPAALSWKSIPSLAARAGADGVPIVLLLNFLVGFVMAFQSSRQLQLYGANIYVADVVGISVTRELAPLMTAIIMAGRSGASFAAELGTMSVSQEIDALRTMGFSPAPYLVLPRVLALAIAAPVLTLLGDVVGVVGGLVVGVASLHLGANGFVSELRTAVVPSDVWTGIVKSVAFGIAIAFIGCQQGLATRGSAAGVGRSTTATVVISLFTIVIVDTIFTVLFRGFGQ